MSRWISPSLDHPRRAVPEEMERHDEEHGDHQVSEHGGDRQEQSEADHGHVTGQSGVSFLVSVCTSSSAASGRTSPAPTA